MRTSFGPTCNLSRDWRVFGFGRIDSASGAANEDSPLVRRTSGPLSASEWPTPGCAPSAALKTALVWHLLLLARSFKTSAHPVGRLSCIAKREKSMNLTVNGQLREVPAEWQDEKLLDVLREPLDLVGAKFGCGVGLCGACTVLLDDTPVRSCMVARA